MSNLEWLDNESDDFSDDEFGDEDFDDDESNDVLECSACGAEIYEDAVCCPVCGEYVTLETSLWAGRSTLWIILGLLGIVAVVIACSIGF